jgi:hypothetical protein
LLRNNITEFIGFSDLPPGIACYAGLCFSVRLNLLAASTFSLPLKPAHANCVIPDEAKKGTHPGSPNFLGNAEMTMELVLKMIGTAAASRRKPMNHTLSDEEVVKGFSIKGSGGVSGAGPAL